MMLRDCHAKRSHHNKQRPTMKQVVKTQTEGLLAEGLSAQHCCLMDTPVHGAGVSLQPPLWVWKGHQLKNQINLITIKLDYTPSSNLISQTLTTFGMH